MSCSKARSLPEVKYIGGRLLSGFGRKKSGVLISPKGKRERRRLRCRIRFSMCHYLGGGLHGRQKRVKAQSESSKSVVNSVLISREMPVFPGFLEIIRVVITNIINSFNVFESVTVMTSGGPLNSTTTLVHQIYTRSFTEYKLGYGSAIAMVLSIFVLLFTFLSFRFGSQSNDTGN